MLNLIKISKFTKFIQIMGKKRMRIAILDTRCRVYTSFVGQNTPLPSIDDISRYEKNFLLFYCIFGFYMKFAIQQYTNIDNLDKDWAKDLPQILKNIFFLVIFISFENGPAQKGLRNPIKWNLISILSSIWSTKTI